MKQSTFSAVMANNLLTVLQGYSKTIRLLLVMFVALTVSAEVWADYTIAFKSADGADGSTAQTTIANLISSGSTNVSTISATRAYNGKSGYGIKLGSSSSTGNVNMTLANSAQIKASKLVVKAAYYDSGKTLKVTVTYTDNTTTTKTITPASSLTDYDVSLTDTKTIKQIKIESVTASKGRMYCHSIKVVAASAAPSFTITAQSNNTNYGTVSLSGTTITATPKTGYRVSTTTPYTISPSGSATITQNGNTFTVTPSANTTITINFEALPKYTVTLNAGPGTCAASVAETSAGEGVTLPTPTLTGCDEWSFAGWKTTSAVTTETTTKPTLIAAGTYKPASNITLYAVYQRTEGGGGTSYQFQKVTALSQIKAGGTFIITNGSYYLPNDQASSSGPVKANMVAVTNGVVTGTVTDAMKWTFSAADANGKITIKSAANSNYYLYTTNSNGGLRVNNTSDTWTFEEYTVSNILGFAMKSTSNSRYCAVYTDGSDWRSYTTKNAANYKTNSGRLDLYKYTEISSNTTYYHSTPDCTTETANCSLLKFTTDITENYTATYTQNATANTLTVSAAYDGNSTGVTYQWYSNTTNSNTNGTLITNAASASYKPSTTEVGTTYYYCEATYDEECTITSHVATVTITAPVPTFTVTFNSDRGSAVESQTIEEGNKAIKPEDPTKKGYDFVGWYNGNTEFDFDEVITGDITLTAKWKIITYNITYEGLEDATHSNPSTYDVETATITFTAPSNREGHVFKGWTPATIDKGSTGDKTVTATWAKVYTITWLVDGKSYQTGNPTTSVEEGQNITAIPFDPPLLTCAVKFMGWSIESSGSTPEDPSYYSDLFTTLDEAKVISIDEDMTFHAVFATKEDGIQSESVTVTKESFSTVDGTLDENISYDSQQGYGTAAPAISNNAIRLYQNANGKTGGYIILSAKNDCKITSASITSTSSSTTGYIFSNTTYAPDKDDFIVNDYAIPANGTYTVPALNTSYITFACFGTTSSTRLNISKISVTYIKEGDPAYSAYITSCCETEAPTDGFIDGVKGSGNAMSVTLYWKDANDYKRYHVVCDELEIDEHVENTNFQTKEVLSECTTYIFKVSSAPKDGCESPVLEIEATPFIPKTIVFVDEADTTKQSTTCDLPSITVPTPTAQNCSTYVWIDEATGTEYTAGQTITPAKDMTIVAEWSVITFTITFKDWDGEVLQTSTVECGKKPTLPADPTRPEDNRYKYTFAGWNPSVEEADGNQTYTATYDKEAHPITVIWMVNGEEYTLGNPSTTVSAGEKVAKLPTPPSPDDYCGQVFAGWTDQPIDGAPIADAPAVLFNTSETSPTLYKEGDKTTVTFYAVFADIKE